MMVGVWAVILSLATGGGPPAGLAFERASDEERAAFAEKVRAMSGAPPGVELHSRGKRIAVLATLGEKRTGGYEIRIERLALRGRALTVHTRATEPARDAMVTMALTYPFDVVWVPAARLGGRRAERLALRLVDQKGNVLAEGGPGLKK